MGEGIENLRNFEVHMRYFILFYFIFNVQLKVSIDFF
jgi:hypothetical protein